MYQDYHRPTEPQLAEAVASWRGVSASDVAVTRHTDAAGTSDGENFTSVMRLLTVESSVRGEKCEDQFMVKLHTKGSPLTQCWEEMEMFPREAQFYSKVVPALNKLASDGRKLPFSRVPFAREDVPIIIMENLKNSGFSMCDASRGWDSDRFELTFRELARYHAATYHYLQTFDGGLDGVRRHLTHICDDGYKPLWPLKTPELNEGSRKMTMAAINAGIALAEKALDDPDLWARFQAYDIEAKAGESNRPSEKFDVIIRGDAWSNNFMFRHDPESGKPVEVRFVDLQVTKRCRPTYDLAVLAATSATEDIFTNSLDDLLRTYHSSLLSCLKEYGYDGSVYPYETFLEDYKHSMGYAMFFGLLNIQTVLNAKIKDVAKSGDMEAMRDSMEKDKGELGNENLVKRLCALIREGAKRGLY